MVIESVSVFLKPSKYEFHSNYMAFELVIHFSTFNLDNIVKRCYYIDVTANRFTTPEKKLVSTFDLSKKKRGKNPIYSNICHNGNEHTKTSQDKKIPKDEC